MAQFLKHILAKWTRGEWVNDKTNEAIAGFSIDSRSIDAQQMFVALRTDKRNGHDYIADAQKRGAAAALTEECVARANIPQLRVRKGDLALQDIAYNHRCGFNGPIVGITGSCGKTSTKDMLSHLLGESRVLRTAGNYNNYLGVPLTLLRLENDKHDVGVVEVGINMEGEMAGLAKVVDADYGIVTMIGRAHLEGLGSTETVAREKSNLLRMGKTKAGIFYPASCLQYESFQNLSDTPNWVLTPLGQEMQTSEWIRPVNYWCLLDDLMRWNLFLRSDNGIERRFVIPNLSSGMRQNLALAIVAASELGVSDELIQKRILKWYPSENRGEILKSENAWIYSDCYNANPDSMKDSLNSFDGTFDRKMARMYVLGSMYELGDDSESYHREITARLKVRPEDRFVFVGKHASEYRVGLTYNGVNTNQVQCVAHAEDATEAVHGFKGAIFLKGSRTNRLETLIPNDAQKTVLESGKLCW